MQCYIIFPGDRGFINNHTWRNYTSGKDFEIQLDLKISTIAYDLEFILAPSYTLTNRKFNIASAEKVRNLKPFIFHEKPFEIKKDLVFLNKRRIKEV